VHWPKRSNFRKRIFQLKIQPFVLTENSAKQFALIAQGILKLDNFQRKTLEGQIFTYIRVRVGDVSWGFAHEAKSGEVALLALDLLILFWARGVVTQEVEVAQGSTRLGHDLLGLLLLVTEEVLLLVVVLTVVVSDGVVVLVGGVKFFPLEAVGDEVGAVATLEAALRWSPPLLTKLVQDVKLSCQQGNLIIRDALILLIKSCNQRRQDKLQRRWDSVDGVSIMATNMSTSNQSFTSKRSKVSKFFQSSYFHTLHMIIKSIKHLLARSLSEYTRETQERKLPTMNSNIAK
jgi:hypothetical protein